jgi:hypothetical protein
MGNTVILHVGKKEDSGYEAANGRYQFESKSDESLEQFRFRITKHFMSSTAPKTVWFQHEK